MHTHNVSVGTHVATLVCFFLTYIFSASYKYTVCITPTKHNFLQFEILLLNYNLAKCLSLAVTYISGRCGGGAGTGGLLCALLLCPCVCGRQNFGPSWSWRLPGQRHLHLYGRDVRGCYSRGMHKISNLVKVRIRFGV